MRRFRIRRRRLAGLALLPVAALALTISIAPATGAGQAKPAISAASKQVRYGHQVRLAGRFAAAPNHSVDLRFRRAGAKRAVHVESTRTNDSGRYGARVKPRGIGRWHAELTKRTGSGKDAGGANRSRETLVRVRARFAHARIVHRNVSVGRKVSVRGRVLPRGKRKVIVATRGDRKAVHSHGNGHFSVHLRATHPGTARVRVRAKSNSRARGAHRRVGRFTAYRKALASWYSGSGGTACGRTLTSSTLGVAHKSLPCGTKVKFRYHGHKVTVPVIDRGPYAGGREYDLTYAAKQRLHFPGVATLQASR